MRSQWIQVFDRTSDKSMLLHRKSTIWDLGFKVTQNAKIEDGKSYAHIRNALKWKRNKSFN